MPTYVEHRETGEFFILLGSGFGIFQSKDNYQLSQGNHHLVALCDKNGKIGWLNSEKLKVIHVDGVNVNELEDLGEFK